MIGCHAEGPEARVYSRMYTPAFRYLQSKLRQRPEMSGCKFSGSVHQNPISLTDWKTKGRWLKCMEVECDILRGGIKQGA